ncbi:MAG: hypothetical protein QG626_891, partial [Patescibacteria group bacterium]|nr:hypothetical protein [Patescibacteria group bacterium]
MPVVIGTHNGKFHTDEVVAIALLLRVCEDIPVKVVRLNHRDQAGMNACNILVDTGRIYDPDQGRFDHHQTGGAGEWPDDGTKLSSCGLVWREYHAHICPNPAVAAMVERALIVPVDARDNGQQPERRTRDIPSLADCVDALNFAWDETGDEDATFMEAVRFVGRYLDRLIVRSEAQYQATELVRAAIAKTRSSRLIILEQGLPWHEVIITESPDTHFVVLPGGKGEWLVQAVPVKLGTQQPLRKRLPIEWAGLKDQALTDVTGVPDAVFAHNAGHIAVASSLAGAL